MLIISIQNCPNSLWHGMALNLPFIVQLHTSSQMKAASLSGRLIDAFFALSERNVVLSVPKNSLLFPKRLPRSFSAEETPRFGIL